MGDQYRPSSPDLSFLTSPQRQQHQHQHQQLYQAAPSASYAPRSPDIPSFESQPLAQHQNAHYGADLGGPAYLPPIPALPAAHSFAPTPNRPPAEYAQPLYTNQIPHAQPVYVNQIPPYEPQREIQNQYGYVGARASAIGPAAGLPRAEYANQIPTYEPLRQTQNQYSFDGATEILPTMASHSARPHVKDEPSYDDNMILEPSSLSSAQPVHKDPNPNNIEIRTKFPVARIKRIMQADEDVGKVAQVTPVAVNKALELFMIALVTGAADKVREKGGKRVTAQHLKSVVLGEPQFDFLNEIVGRVADVQENAGGEGRKKREKVVKESSDSEEEKPKKARGRRKKSDD